MVTLIQKFFSAALQCMFLREQERTSKDHLLFLCASIQTTLFQLNKLNKNYDNFL